MYDTKSRVTTIGAIINTWCRSYKNRETGELELSIPPDRIEGLCRDLEAYVATLDGSEKICIHPSCPMRKNK